MVTAFVVFSSAVDFHIRAMYTGKVPVAEHDTSVRGLTGLTSESILGATSVTINVLNQLTSPMLLNL